MKRLMTAYALGLILSACSTPSTRSLVRDAASAREQGGVGNYLFPKDFHSRNEGPVTADFEDVYSYTQASPVWVPSAELIDGSIEISDEVRFQEGSATLTADSKIILDDVAQLILAHQDQISEVEVAGHTDTTGTRTRNMDLSQKRAEAVAEYLILRGVRRDQVLPQGYGDTEPLYDPDTSPEGEVAQNRRVEFHVKMAEGPESLAE